MVRPGLFTILVGSALVGSAALGVLDVLAIQIVCAFVSFVVGVALLRHYLPAEVARTAPAYETRDWLRSAAPMFLAGGSVIIMSQLDIVLVGVIRGSYEAGIYSVASKIAVVLNVVTAGITLSVAPAVARLYAAGQRSGLELELKRTARLMLAGTTNSCGRRDCGCSVDS